MPTLPTTQPPSPRPSHQLTPDERSRGGKSASSAARRDALGRFTIPTPITPPVLDLITQAANNQP